MGVDKEDAIALEKLFENSTVILGDLARRCLLELGTSFFLTRGTEQARKSENQLPVWALFSWKAVLRSSIQNTSIIFFTGRFTF